MNNLKNIFTFVIISLIFAPAFVFAQVNAISVTGEEPTAISIDSSIGVASNAQLFDGVLTKGQTSDDVAELQTILATDPNIYPEGITSGYYGTLTENAVKRLQERYGLPSTGILDDATKQVIYPRNITLQVVKPNGGEAWQSGISHRILWRSTVGPIFYEGREIAPAQTIDGVVGDAIEKPSFAPFFPRVSIDLVRDSKPNFRYHIGTANIYDSGIAWKPPVRLDEVKDYRVVVSVGNHIPCLYRLDEQVSNQDLTIASPCPHYDHVYGGRDQSDRPFGIFHKDVPPPNGDVIAKIKSQLRIMESSLETMLASLRQVNALLNEL